MPDEDIDRPPASDDDDVQGVLDARWRDAMASSRSCMESLRVIHPELMEHLPEAAERAIASALASTSAAYRELHRAGPHIVGQANYDEFLQAQTRRAVGG